MERRLCCFVVFFLHIISSCVSATSRPFVSNDGIHQTDTFKASMPSTHKKKHLPLKSQTWQVGASRFAEETYDEDMSRIGSNPPSCEHKCCGCTPCEAIQVPTTSKHSQRGLQYANYEPEGWKCKCGPALYSP